MFLDTEPASHRSLNAHDTFRFECRAELACFNRCCCDKHLPLSPYDVLRLKHALHLHSDDFLSRYTVYRIDPASGFPILSLQMMENSERSCPFVTTAGCRVYIDRPTVCRLFPLGRSSRRTRGTNRPEAVHYLLDVPGCLGMEQERVWCVREWIADQGLRPFLETNDRMLRLLFHPSRKPGRTLSERQLQMIIVAAYSLDVFREFVFGTEFLKRYPVDRDVQEQIQTDDLALLYLGLSYLERTLFD